MLKDKDTKEIEESILKEEEENKKAIKQENYIKII